MAGAKLQIPSSNYVVPGSHLLSTISLPEPITITTPNAESVATEWVSSFNQLIQLGASTFSTLFSNQSYWRDLLCLTWDFHVLQGPDQITSFVKSQTSGCRIKSLAVDTSSDVRKPQISAIDFEGNIKGIQSFLIVETDVGQGRGLVRLLPEREDPKKWKAFTLFTALEELRGHEELVHERRPTGTEHGTQSEKKNWKERRLAEENCEGDLEPVVLIIGSGQGGLTIAARLKQLGIRALIIDQNARVGDNWRNRYHHLVLHDPVWYDHMPYLNFPSNWPIFTPKDKLAEWFEFYANALELNIWTKTSIKYSNWNETQSKWVVTLERDKDGTKENHTFHPRHIIQATGISGEAAFPSDIPGLTDFQGDLLVHSSQFHGPKSGTQGKKAVIVGSCNSAHDIAQDYYDYGYHVTIVQRSSTLVVSSQSLIDITMKGLYSEDGPPLEDADLLNMSIPNPVLKRFLTSATVEMTRRDAPLLQNLRTAGFALDNGPDVSGLWMKYLHRGGGYYIDVGASTMIASGQIKIKQGQEITRVLANGLAFTDGTELAADEIVFATGFGNMRQTARKIFGDAVADRVQDVWGMDEEGETRGMWRRTGHPGFWFFGGNMAQCRFWSRRLALQIKALEVGLMRYEDA